MAHHKKRTKAIFLKKQDQRKSDQFFTVFTQEYGKITVLGKGIRKITSKLRSASELFYYTDIEFIEGKASKILTDAVLEDKFKEIRKSEEKLDVCYKIADLFCLVQESKDEKIWNLLLSTFNNLNEFEQIDLIYFHFLWNFLSILGYAPQLHNCALCSEKLLPETLFFSPTEGGVCCWRCNVEEKKEITVGAIQVIRLFLKEKQTILNKLRVINVDKESLEEVSLFYFSFLRDAINPQK